MVCRHGGWLSDWLNREVIIREFVLAVAVAGGYKVGLGSFCWLTRSLFFVLATPFAPLRFRCLDPPLPTDTLNKARFLKDKFLTWRRLMGLTD